MTTGLLLAAAVAAGAAVVEEPVVASASDAALELDPMGSYETGIFDESAAEIVVFHAATQRTVVVNAAQGLVEVLDASDPAGPTKLFDVETVGVASDDGSVVSEGAIANSVAIRDDGLGVVAVENGDKTAAGWLVFFDAAGDGGALGAVRVGALPDMVTISPDGAYAVVADEGEPADDFSVDPEGSVGVVTLPDDVAAPSQDAVAIADFRGFEEGGPRTLPEDVRLFGPEVPTPDGDSFPVSQNLEPEYVAVDGTGTAYAALQEANAVAVVDLATATVTDIWPLGFKDHSREGNGLDASDRDPEDAPIVNIATHPGLNGVYMPDGMDAYTTGGQTYLVTANEGDAREWGDYVDGARVKDLGDAEETDAPALCAHSPLAGLTEDTDLGRLEVVTDLGLREDGSCFEELYSYGGRSFSIWTTEGEQVFDSGDDFEQIVAETIPEYFNSDHGETNLEGRSDAKGPEPESVTVGEVDGRTYAFVGLERVGGLMVYDITDPAGATFVTYVNNRDFAYSVEDADDPASALAAAGDLGPEGLAFVPAADSPIGDAMVIVGNEVSGTTTYFSVTSITEEPTEQPTEQPTGTDEGTPPGDDGTLDTLPETGTGTTVAALVAVGLVGAGAAGIWFRRRSV
ncbi:choice-of-anchor I family protein [Georgenia halophila]|uniref:Choice-of-anchor I family protein n=1 Tax=Georgenia halophila TaxID=620889 RepID=A0ABP8L9K7_9MICO